MRDVVFVAGHGKLATAIQEKIQPFARQAGYEISCVANWDDFEAGKCDMERAVIVHVGSGGQLFEIISCCQNHGIPLIQASTGMKWPEKMSDEIRFILVEAPNLSIPMIKLLYAMEEMGNLFNEYKTSITESHQRTKTSPPGTALEMARSLGVESCEIRSIRDEAVQQNSLGVPEAYLAQHAVHEIGIEGGGCRLSLRTEVYGLDSYVEGLVRILGNIDRLSPGRHRLTDLVRQRAI